MTPEMKAKLAEGRRRAAEARKAAAAASPENEQHLPPIEPAPVEVPVPVEEPAAPEPLALTAEELAHIREEAAKQIDEEVEERRAKERKALVANALKDEVERQRREAGLTDAGDDIIEWMVNVAPFSPGLQIDGHTYAHGHWMKTSRRVYDSCRDAMARSWESEDRAGNPNKKFAEWRAAAGIVNPMFRESRTPDGTFTVGLAQLSLNAKTGALA